MGSSHSDDAAILAKQGSITFIGTAFHRLAEFLFTITVTNLIAPDLFGVFSLVLATVMFTRRVADLNLYRSIDYFIPDHLLKGELSDAKATLFKILTLSVVSAILGSIILVVFSDSIGNLFNEPRVSNIIPLLSILIILGTLERILVRVFNSIKDMRSRVLVHDIIRPGGKLVLTTGFLVLGFGITGLVLGYLIALGIAVIFGTILILKKANWISNSLGKGVPIPSIVTYSIPLLFSGVIYGVVGQIDFFLLGYFLEDTEIVGIYKVGYLLAGNLSIILASLKPIFKPMISEDREQTEVIKFQYSLVTRWILIFTIPIALVLTIAPDIYLSILFTPAYAAAGTAVTVLAVGYMLNIAIGPEGMMLEGLGYTRLTLVNSIILVIINTGLDILLIPRFGMLGAAIASGTATMSGAIVGVVEIYYLRDIHPFSMNIIKLGFAIPFPMIAGIVIKQYIMNIYLLSVIFPICILTTYLIALLILNPFTTEDMGIANSIDEKIGRPVLGTLLNVRGELESE